MNVTRLVVCAVLALPAGWFAAVLVERVPDRLALFDPPKPVRPSRRDLIVHVLVLVLFVMAALRFDEADIGVLAGFLLLFGVLAALERDRHRVLPPARSHRAAHAGGVAAAGGRRLRLADDASRIRYALAGGALYFGFLFVAHLISPRGMGFGDVKLAALMGLYVGWLGSDYVEALALVLWAMLIGFLSGTVLGVALLVTRRRSRPFPFGPFLALGTVAAIMLSESLVAG